MLLEEAVAQDMLAIGTEVMAVAHGVELETVLKTKMLQEEKAQVLTMAVQLILLVILAMLAPMATTEAAEAVAGLAAALAQAQA